MNKIFYRGFTNQEIDIFENNLERILSNLIDKEILIAASAEGIYGVTRIPFPAEVNHIKEFFNSPADYEIACYLALGYPVDGAKRIKQYPVKIEDKIHWNSW